MNEIVVDPAPQKTIVFIHVRYHFRIQAQLIQQFQRTLQKSLSLPERQCLIRPIAAALAARQNDPFEDQDPAP